MPLTTARHVPRLRPTMATRGRAHRQEPRFRARRASCIQQNRPRPRWIGLPDPGVLQTPISPKWDRSHTISSTNSQCPAPPGTFSCMKPVPLFTPHISTIPRNRRHGPRRHRREWLRQRRSASRVLSIPLLASPSSHVSSAEDRSWDVINRNPLAEDAPTCENLAATNLRSL